MIELLTISVTVGVSVLLLGVGYALGRQSARPPVQLEPSWRTPREGGYRGQGGAIPTSPPSGTSATSRGRTPPPPRGGSGQATARDEWHDWGSSSPDLSYMPRLRDALPWRKKNR